MSCVSRNLEITNFINYYHEITVKRTTFNSNLTNLLHVYLYIVYGNLSLDNIGVAKQLNQLLMVALGFLDHSASWPA